MLVARIYLTAFLTLGSAQIAVAEEVAKTGPENPAERGKKVARCAATDDGELPPAVRGRCYTLRPGGVAPTALNSLVDHSYFATSCVVPLKRGSHPGSNCDQVDVLIRDEDEISITEWGTKKDEFSLSIRRRIGADRTYVASNLALIPHYKPNGPAKELVWLEAKGSLAGIGNVTYYVYLQDLRDDGEFRKKYVIEAFLDRNPSPPNDQCEAERPRNSNVTERLCTEGWIDARIRENNSGGGGEPPPDPKR